MDRNLPDDSTDQQITEASCKTYGCGNYRAKGGWFCEDCAHDEAHPLPYDLKQRKLALDNSELKNKGART